MTAIWKKCVFLNIWNMGVVTFLKRHFISLHISTIVSISKRFWSPACTDAFFSTDFLSEFVLQNVSHTKNKRKLKHVLNWGTRKIFTSTFLKVECTEVHLRGGDCAPSAGIYSRVSFSLTQQPSLLQMSGTMQLFLSRLFFIGKRSAPEHLIDHWIHCDVM
jgi:hypothetical protein